MKTLKFQKDIIIVTTDKAPEVQRLRGQILSSEVVPMLKKIVSAVIIAIADVLRSGTRNK